MSRLGEFAAACLELLGVRRPAVVAFATGDAGKPLLLVPVSVGEAGPFRFVLDTGASLTMISPGLAAQLALDGGSDADGVGAGGSMRVSIHTVGRISVSTATVENLDVAVGDLSPIERAAGTRFDGILGYNFLSRFAITIDYGSETVTLRPLAQ
jgi:hypothetical protein